MTSAPPTLNPAQPTRETLRVPLADDLETTLHVLRFDRFAFALKVVAFDPSRRLLEWCLETKTEFAMVGGFYVRPDGIPLGFVQTAGGVLPSRPFDDPWDMIRACIQSVDGDVSISSRIELPADPPGQVLQAGPRLVRAGICQVFPGSDPEGFSSGSNQFDSDITDGRYPRAALGLSSQEIIAAVCDGRSSEDAGLTLAELANCMCNLGAQEAINLDGGGSASLVSGGELLNVPREEHGQELDGGREIATALTFTLR